MGPYCLSITDAHSQRRNVSGIPDSLQHSHPQACVCICVQPGCPTSCSPAASLAVWLVYEQVAIAALDSGATEFAASIVKIISERFPLSSRTRRLQVRGGTEGRGNGSWHDADVQ